MITKRQKLVLEAVILDYVQTCEPVGSRTVARKYMPQVSSATIRNEMSDLEELGYLTQPHVSAGRVPSDNAYRLYVDHLIREGLIDTSPREDTQKALSSRMHQMDDVVYAMGQALSDWTHYTTVIMKPRQSDLKVSTLQLIPLRPGAALLVIVTDSGIIRDAVVHVAQDLDADKLYAISRLLAQRLSGKSLEEVQSILHSFSQYVEGDPKVLNGIADLARQIQKQSSSDNLIICGSENILYHPEYADVQKARRFLKVLEDKDKLIRLMRHCSSEGLGAYIGSEIGIADMNDCSIVTAAYQAGKNSRGTVSIIGPTRMNYQQVLQSLSSTADMLSRMLRRTT
jgi:heat-inducible transcriptional repressor